MMMEGNEYGQSVTLAAFPVSSFKRLLSLVCPLAAYTVVSPLVSWLKHLNQPQP